MTPSRAEFLVMLNFPVGSCRTLLLEKYPNQAKIYLNNLKTETILGSYSFLNGTWLDFKLAESAVVRGKPERAGRVERGQCEPARSKEAAQAGPLNL